MKFGAHLPHVGANANRGNLIRFAQEAESLGFDSVWVSDHIAWPNAIASRYPYNEGGDFPRASDVAWFDGLATLIFVAAVTERVQLGASVMILGYRPAVQTAKLWATLDQLSHGRAVMGVGVGWMREEFDALDMPFDHRGARADETLRIFDALFRQSPATFEGRFQSFDAVGFQPKPVDGHIPLWVGGHARPAFRRAARFGDAFHAVFLSPPGVTDQWTVARAICEEEGRDPDSLALSLRVRLRMDQEVEDIGSLHGDADHIVERIGRYDAAGVSHITMDVVADGGVEGQLEAMRRFASDVIPQLA